MSNAIDKEIKELLTVLGKIQVSGDVMKVHIWAVV